MMEKYILDGKKPVPCDDLLRWGDMFGSEARIVANSRVGDVEISTVFIGLDHSFGNGPPILFETMVFGGEHDQDMERYSTWEEAEAGHQAMVDRISKSVSSP